jgi:hypothetical protein
MNNSIIESTSLCLFFDIRKIQKHCQWATHSVQKCIYEYVHYIKLLFPLLRLHGLVAIIARNTIGAVIVQFQSCQSGRSCLFSSIG